MFDTFSIASLFVNLCRNGLEYNWLGLWFHWLVYQLTDLYG